MARLKIGMPKFKAPNVAKDQPDAGNAAPAAGKNRMVLAGATLCCALGIGYVMQYGGGSDSAAKSAVAVSDIVLTSSASVVPTAPAMPAMAPKPEPMPITLAAVDADAPVMMDPVPSTAAPLENACDIVMDAQPAAGALVDLTLSAPCNADERLTVHHNGMMITEITDADGGLSVTLPALNENAVFIAAFGNGEGAVANATVTSLEFYDRVVVQWKGDAGLQLHAREFDAAYFSEGHVWSDQAGELGKAAMGEGGFLVRLGHETAPDALRAEIYSFPSGTARQSGDVILTVEAEVTSSNCDKQVEAQTLELGNAGALRTRDVLLDMPGCAAVGDFLVLKNLVQDLTIASR